MKYTTAVEFTGAGYTGVVFDMNNREVFRTPVLNDQLKISKQIAEYLSRNAGSGLTTITSSIVTTQAGSNTSAGQAVQPRRCCGN